MKGYLLLVLLVATAVVAQTAKRRIKSPGPNTPPLPPRRSVKTEAVKGQKEAQAKTKAAQEGTAEAQAETKKQPGQAEVAQVKTEAGRRQKSPRHKRTKIRS